MQSGTFSVSSSPPRTSRSGVARRVRGRPPPLWFGPTGPACPCRAPTGSVPGRGCRAGEEELGRWQQLKRLGPRNSAHGGCAYPVRQNKAGSGAAGLSAHSTAPGVSRGAGGTSAPLDVVYPLVPAATQERSQQTRHEFVAQQRRFSSKAATPTARRLRGLPGDPRRTPASPPCPL